MTYDLVIKGGRLINAFDDYVADVAIAGEQIAAIGSDLTGQNVLDARGLYVLPGAIDGHVHLTDPTYPPYSLPTADDFATGSRAAAFGGVTTLIDFAQPAAGQSLIEALDRRQEDADGHSLVDYGLHLTLRDPDPARLAEIPAIFARGVPSVKLFMAYDGYRLPDVVLFRVMEATAANGGLAIVHAENDDIIHELRSRLAAEGKTGPRWHVASCPAITEGEAIHRALAFANLAAADVLIFHITCAEGVREVGLAKSRGQTAWGETCPQYLVLTDEVYAAGDLRSESFMVRPPIRDRVHQLALWQGLARGQLDIVSTDHCPRQPLADHHPAGMAGIESRLALLYTFGVQAGHLSLNQWVAACCTRPAEIFGLARKGRLAPNYDADIVLFDPHRDSLLSSDTMHSASQLSAYAGLKVSGVPVATILRGQVIVRDGAFVGQSGRGQFVARGY